LKVFFDTSAIAKRYVAERGSEKVLALYARADRLMVSIICLPELISTLARLVREKRVTKANYLRLKNDVTADFADVDVSQINADVMAVTVELLESHPLRAMDAIPVACALMINADAFVSADRRQLAAARKAGMKIVDVS
jgi:uncharacterized protein